MPERIPKVSLWKIRVIQNSEMQRNVWMRRVLKVSLVVFFSRCAMRLCKRGRSAHTAATRTWQQHQKPLRITMKLKLLFPSTTYKGQEYPRRVSLLDLINLPPPGLGPIPLPNLCQCLLIKTECCSLKLFFVHLKFWEREREREGLGNLWIHSKRILFLCLKLSSIEGGFQGRSNGCHDPRFSQNTWFR